MTNQKLAIKLPAKPEAQGHQVTLTNTERDDVVRALESRANNLRTVINSLIKIEAYSSMAESRADAAVRRHRLTNEIERINNLLQGKFIAI